MSGLKKYILQIIREEWKKYKKEKDKLIHLYVHGDSDGIYSGVLLASFLQKKVQHPIKFTVVNYDIADWQSQVLPKNSFVLDFLYNPTAVFHADHHATSMKSIIEISAATRVQLLDPERKSCAGLLYDYFKGLQTNWDASPYEELARWADIVDSASYVSAEQVILSIEPALKIRQVLMDRGVDPVGIIHKLLESKGNLEKVAEDYREVWEKRQKKVEKAMLQYKKMITRMNNVGYLNLIGSWVAKDKYLPFYLWPDLQYMVTVTGWKGEYQIGAGKNPWMEVEDPVNLAKLAEEFKGGGHRDVMGVNSSDEQFIRNTSMEIFRTLAYRGALQEEEDEQI